MSCLYRCGVIISSDARSQFSLESDLVRWCSCRAATAVITPVAALASVATRIVLAAATAPTTAVVFDADPAAPDQLRQAPTIRARCPQIGPHVVVTRLLPSGVYAPTTHCRRLVQCQPVLYRIHDHVRVYRMTVAEMLQQYPRDQRGYGDVFRSVGAVFRSVYFLRHPVVGHGFCRRI